MKNYKYLYGKVIDRDTIDKAYKKLRVGKTKRAEIQKIDDNYEFYAECMRYMLIGFIYDERRFSPPKHDPIIIVEHGKERTIYMPSIWEQWVHHIVIQVLEPIIVKSSWKLSCGSFPDRGAHYAKRYIEKWSTDYKQTKYFLKFDIRHFYNSIDHDILWEYMRRSIKDDLFMRLCKRCLMHFNKGLPLGYYVSQWFANYFLEPLDKLIAETYGMRKMVRYMDDVVVFSGNKKQLRKLLEDVRILLSKMHLKLKDNWQICRMEYNDKNGKKRGRKLDFMGFVFSRKSTTIRKSIMLSISRTARYFGKHTRWYLKKIRAMLSYFGWIKASDTYGFYLSHVKPFVEFRKLRSIISRIERSERNDKMDGRTLLGYA